MAQFIRVATDEDRERVARFELRYAQKRGIEPVLWVSTLQSWFDGFIEDAPEPTQQDRRAYMAGIKRALQCKDAIGISGKYVIGKEVTSAS